MAVCSIRTRAVDVTASAGVHGLVTHCYRNTNIVPRVRLVDCCDSHTLIRGRERMQPSGLFGAVPRNSAEGPDGTDALSLFRCSVALGRNNGTAGVA